MTCSRRRCLKPTAPSPSATSAGWVTGSPGKVTGGFLEIDVLVDLDTDAVYLGELNPRISGASSMTNVTAGAYADVPLFLFHLLEFMDVDYTLDVDEINERRRDLAAMDVWSQLIMKEPGASVERILVAPRTGTWHLDLRTVHSPSTRSATTGTRSPVRTRRSACASTRQATSISIAPLGHPRHQRPDADRGRAHQAVPPLHRWHPRTLPVGDPAGSASGQALLLRQVASRDVGQRARRAESPASVSDREA